MSENESENEKADLKVYIVERGQRLSQSLIWSHMRQYYDRQGVDAWKPENVPHNVTTNPHIARAYADVAFAWLRDCVATSRRPSAEQPLTIIELGSGAGRFAYHFLTHLTRIHQRSRLREFPVRYIMTDSAERNLEFWRSHPSLKQFVEAGTLDFALLDATAPAPLTLTQSGITIGPGSLAVPSITIANYLFDTLPQDSFGVNEGALFEGRAVVAVEDPAITPDHPDLIRSMHLNFDLQQAPDDYYGDPDLDAILRQYASTLCRSTFLFPHVALTALRWLAGLANGQMLLLAADKGYNTEYELLAQEGPGIGIHDGAFSLMVNFHAIGQYAAMTGGQYLTSGHLHPSLDIVACILGLGVEDTVETVTAFETRIADFGPEDHHLIRRFVVTHREGLRIEEAMAWIRAGYYDAHDVHALASQIHDQMDNAKESLKRDLYALLRRVMDQYYPMADAGGLLTVMGVLLMQVEHYTEALSYLQRGVKIGEPTARAYYTMGRCYQQLKNLPAALECVNRALEIDPVFDGARLLRISLEADAAMQPQQPAGSLPAATRRSGEGSS